MLYELQPRFKILGYEFLRKPGALLDHGDVFERSTLGLVDDFTSGTYPSIRFEIIGDQVRTWS